MIRAINFNLESRMIRTWMVAGFAAGAALSVSAQTLGPAPTPGLWESETKLLLNGKDLGQAMRKMREDLLKSMPPEQRKQMAAMMGGDMGGMGGTHQECVTPEEVAKAIDPKRALADMQKEQPNCRFEPVKAGGSTLSFKGRCADPQGFTGDIQGEFQLVSSKSWSWRYSGKGRMPGGGADMGMLGIKPGADGLIEMLATGTGRWVAASCGNVKP